MKALKLSTNTRDRQKLDTKCKELLTRAEKIKETKDWPPSIDATTQNVPPSLKASTSTRKLTTREEIILLEGAKLNGFIFPPWVNSPSSEEFEIEDGGELYWYVCEYYPR